MTAVQASPTEISQAKRAFVVVGMHRSGTSAMTRTLSLLGAALPKRVMEAHDDNPVGFWEPQSVADLNDEILQALDSEWDDVFAFRPKQYLSNFDHFYIGRAVEVLNAEFNGSEVIALKDPRISVLTKFWDRALREAGYATHYIVMVRNPLEVADSLRIRNAFPREKSLLLWSSYMLALDGDTREQKRTFVAFDQLMSDWRAVRDRIQTEAGIPFFRDTPAAAIEIDRFIDGRLRHHEFAADDLLARADVPEEVKALYRIFSDACYGQPVDPVAVDKVREEFEKIDAFVGPVVADLRQRTSSLTKDVLELQSAHSEVERRADSLAETLAASEAERNGLVEAVRQRDSRIEETTRERDSFTEEAASLTARLAEAEQRSREHLAERDLLTKQISDAAKVRDELMLRELELRQRLEEIEHSRAELERTRLELEELRTELAERTAERGQLWTERADLEKKLDNAAAELERKKVELERARSENDRRAEELNRAFNAAQEKCREHDKRWAAHFDETATLSRMLLQRERDALKETEKVRRLREIYHALAGQPRWWAFLPRSRQNRMEQDRLRRLGLFDAQSYLRKNPDVAQAGMDPVFHFLNHGIDEDRQV
jgi:hypothetical protein